MKASAQKNQISPLTASMLTRELFALASYFLKLHYPRDALHSAVFAVVTCLCVCVSVHHTPLLFLNG